MIGCTVKCQVARQKIYRLMYVKLKMVLTTKKHYSCFFVVIKEKNGSWQIQLQYILSWVKFYANYYIKLHLCKYALYYQNNFKTSIVLSSGANFLILVQNNPKLLQKYVEVLIFPDSGDSISVEKVTQSNINEHNHIFLNL